MSLKFVTILLLGSTSFYPKVLLVVSKTMIKGLTLIKTEIKLIVYNIMYLYELFEKNH